MRGLGLAQGKEVVEAQAEALLRWAGAEVE